jgi:hypothetical protein
VNYEMYGLNGTTTAFIDSESFDLCSSFNNGVLTTTTLRRCIGGKGMVSSVVAKTIVAYDCEDMGTFDAEDIHAFNEHGDLIAENIIDDSLIELNGGTLTLDPSCTAGILTLYGNCELVDNSVGLIVIDHRITTSSSIIAILSRPSLSLYEGWQDEAGIDTTVWTTAITATGAVARDVTEPPFLKILLSGPANGDTARLYGDQRWFCGPDTYAPNTILRRLVMEFEAKFANVASIDNPTFFMGLASIQLADAATNNIAGFILAADDLNSITDDGIGETTKALGAPVLTDRHKYRIEVLAGIIYFYVDEVLQATHTTAAFETLPDTAMFPVFYLPQEAGASGGELHVGIIRIWTEDILR